MNKQEKIILDGKQYKDIISLLKVVDNITSKDSTKIMFTYIIVQDGFIYSSDGFQAIRIDTTLNFACLFVKEIFWLHGVPKKTLSIDTQNSLLNFGKQHLHSIGIEL